MSRRKKYSNGKGILKIFLIIIGVVVVLFVGLVVYGVIKDFEQEDILKQEIINYSNMDLANGDYTIYVKTKGDYAYIEEAIKKFYKELSDNVKVINHYMLDEELINLLNPDNLIKGRPSFIKSYAVIEKGRTKVINALNRISKLCEKDTIKNLIDKDKIDDYSYKLYEDLMLTEKDIADLTDTKNKMEYLSKNLGLFFDKEVEILNLFKDNDSSWEYKDGQLYFTTDELVNRYNTFYKELTDIASSFDNVSNSNGSKVTA